MASGYTPGVLHPPPESLHDAMKSQSSRGKNGALSHHGAQIQNVKAARVYVFGDGNLVDDDEDEVTEFEMRSRHKHVSSVPKEESRPIYFEKEISEGDTLQAIALKYACNVSELKRLNNLIQDQEFYALKVVKVPMKRHGILSEKVAKNEIQTSQKENVWNGSVSQSEIEDEDGEDMYSENDSQHDFSDPETQMKVLRTLSIRENFSSQGKEAEKFLRKMDADLSKLKTLPRPERESLTEVISVLTNKSIHPLSTASKGGRSRYNGADCGVNWRTVVIITFGIAIIVPLIYILFYVLNEDKK